MLQETDYREALASFATGVTIVTTLDEKGQPIGLTVNSFNSVSLSPPLILWSLKRSSGNFENFLNCHSFCVNILTESQEALANHFASREDNNFSEINWQPTTRGTPRLEGSATWFECRRKNNFDGGDHLIFVGEVSEFSHNSNRQPLLFVNGTFTGLGRKLDYIDHPEIFD